MFKLFIYLSFFSISAWSHPMTNLQQAYHNKGKDYTPRTQHIDTQGRAKFVNHLILQDSPYLLQHAHNPVNWYSFSHEAFNKASKENKPIFISIGYATCHWCHVMEEESFDDIEVADFLNQHFIAIKVDREIRPDVDAAYMAVSQLMNGSGGWPLNAVILPNGKAFFAGTYFPKAQLLSILLQINQLWGGNYQKIVNQANEIDKILNTPNSTASSDIDKAIITKTNKILVANFDELEGGFGQAPKFPHETMLLLLIDEQKRRPNNAQLNAISTTLDTMASGGFYDVVGGGFHRYSTDNAWLFPHFEKMLYNQAQLSLVYTRAYQLTQKPLYKRIAEQTLDYVLKEMQNANGGFFSATDADSEGEEGRFFVWSVKQLQNIFNEAEFKQFKMWFDISPYSDFEGNYVIRFKDINQIKAHHYQQIDALLKKLYAVRIKRQAPLTDNKILLSWNALMIPSLLEAGDILNQSKYTDAGLKLAKYLQSFTQNGVLYRVSIDDKLQTPALFEDYAYLANAYLALFDQTQQQVWLDRLIQLVKDMNQKFWDKKHFGFNIANNNKYINTNNKEIYDGALPSPNGLAYQVLIKLHHRVTGDDFNQQAKQLASAFSTEINKSPYNYSSFILGLSQATAGELSNIVYAYDGRVRVHTQKLDTDIEVKLTLSPDWHINSNQPLQDALIATEITNLDTQHWTIKSINYPKAELAKLSFSEEKISIYKNQVKIKLKLSPNSENYTPATLLLTLQACSDKVCLPPTTLTLKP